MKKAAILVLGLVLILGATRLAVSHCEIPCGIYGDTARIVILREHITTVAKSMQQIQEIGAAGKPNWNQLNRWVTNKEKHADEIQHIVTQYFMTQRVKVPAAGDEKASEKYLAQLTTLHELLVAVMKMKQTTDLEWTTKGRELVDRFVGAYFGPEDRAKLLGSAK